MQEDFPMSDPIVPPMKKVEATSTFQQDPVETVMQTHPPLQAYSNSTVSAVSGTHTGTVVGNGVLGVSAAGDGVHGEAKTVAFSGVAGIHSGGGNGVYGSSSGNAGFFQGNVRVTGDLTVTGDVLLPGADCAEQFDAAGLEGLEPGTLLVMNDEGALRESDEPYDRKVAGVVAGAGEYRPAIVLDSNIGDRPRTTISLVGKTYCKVDASHGAIAVGDLLTTSPTRGYAMRATDPMRAFGAVVGKAMRRVETGQAVIPILVALQ
jgi:hypothetical protein